MWQSDCHKSAWSFQLDLVSAPSLNIGPPVGKGRAIEATALGPGAVDFALDREPLSRRDRAGRPVQPFHRRHRGRLNARHVGGKCLRSTDKSVVRNNLVEQPPLERLASATNCR